MARHGFRMSHLFQGFALFSIEIDDFKEVFLLKMVNEVETFVDKVDVKILDSIFADIRCNHGSNSWEF